MFLLRRTWSVLPLSDSITRCGAPWFVQGWVEPIDMDSMMLCGAVPDKRKLYDKAWNDCRRRHGDGEVLH